MKRKTVKLLAVLSASAVALSYVSVLPSDTGAVITASAEISSTDDPAADMNQDNLFEIGTAEELMWYAAFYAENHGEYSYKGAVLVNDIVINEDLLKDYQTLNDGEFNSWTPIGTSTKSPFVATFDGNGHKIVGLYVTAEQDGGLFGYVGEGAVIKNVTLEESYVNHQGPDGGILCGTATGATIDNCSVDGFLDGGEAARYGMICGNVTNSTMTYCKASGYVTGGNFIGAIAGNVGSTTISDCWSDATTYMKLGGPSGGMFGQATSSGISNCCFAGEVLNEASSVGALIGMVSSGTTVTNSYSCAVVPNGANGLFGTDGAPNLNSSNNYYDYTVSAVKGSGAGYGKDWTDAQRTTTEFGDGTVLALLNSGAGEGHWRQLAGETYPQLVWVERDFYDCVHTNTHSDVDQDSYCDECGKILSNYVKLEGYSLSLDGNIKVNFHLAKINDSVELSEDDDFMDFWMYDDRGNIIPQSHKQVYYRDVANDAKVIDGKTYYVFSYEVPAKDMTRTINAEFASVQAGFSPVYTFSIKDYADYIIKNAAANEEYAKAVPLVKALLNYGAYSQLHFGALTNNLANADIDSTLGELEATDLSEFAGSVSGTLPEGMEYYASSLILKSQTSLRHYFKIDSEVLTELPSFDGYTLTEKSEGLYYLQVDNINAGELGSAKTISISDGSWSITYSPMSYAYLVLKTSNKTSLVNLVKAMYEYYVEATKYASVS